MPYLPRGIDMSAKLFTKKNFNARPATTSVRYAFSTSTATNTCSAAVVINTPTSGRKRSLTKKKLSTILINAIIFSSWNALPTLGPSGKKDYVVGIPRCFSNIYALASVFLVLP